jgi:hypothetical protein
MNFPDFWPDYPAAGNPDVLLERQRKHSARGIREPVIISVIDPERRYPNYDRRMRNGESKTFLRTVGLPATLAVAAGLGMSVTAVAVRPQPASAAPTSTTPGPAELAALPLYSALLALPVGAAPMSPATTGSEPIPPKKLKSALLTAADLPGGYRQLAPVTVANGNQFTEQLKAPLPSTTNCTVKIDPSQMHHPQTSQPLTQHPTSTEPQNSQPLDSSGTTEVRPAEHTASSMLMKGKSGPIVAEMLASGTPRDAGRVVATFAREVRRCPQITVQMAGADEDIIITLAPLGVPQQRDTSAAGATTSIRIGDDDPIAYGKIAALANGPITGAVASLDTENELSGFSGLFRKAVAKLKPITQPQPQPQPTVS